MSSSLAEEPQAEQSEQEPRFYKTYSPHHELPVSGMASITLHALAIGLLVVSYLAMRNFQVSEQHAPPKMSVVQTEGDGGDGNPMGLGSPIGSPETSKTEVNSQTATKATQPDPPMQEKIAEGPKLDLTPPSLDATVSVDPEVIEQLKTVQTAFETRIKDEQDKKPATADVTPPNGKPAFNPKGQLGQGGPGGGVGKGDKKGPGTGVGGTPGGPKATKAEILANRWRFNLSGAPKEHAIKLDSIGFTLAIPDSTGRDFWFIRDLKRRPVELRREKVADWKDAIKWYNHDAASIQGLVQELRLPYRPTTVILLLPADREQIIAQEEFRFAQEQGRDLKSVRGTWFDFRPINGAYQPIALKME